MDFDETVSLIEDTAEKVHEALYNLALFCHADCLPEEDFLRFAGSLADIRSTMLKKLECRMYSPEGEDLGVTRLGCHGRK